MSEIREPSTAMRRFVVLEQQSFEDGEIYWTKAGEVDARNGRNAQRVAIRELRNDEPGDVVFVCIPKRSFRPEHINVATQGKVKVTIGRQTAVSEAA